MKRVIGLLLVLNFVFRSVYSFDKKLESNQDKTNHHFEVQECFFEQKLDHFNSKDNDTWQQRYWYGGKLGQESKNAALLFIHDAYTVSEIDTIDNHFLEPLTENLNVSRFHLEHRFYGKSKPTNDTSLTSLNYLSTDQALADIANFIETITKKHLFSVNEKSKWLVIGISYGGTLATWARFKYPEIIENVVAINAPLLAKVDFGEYYENVVNSLNSYDPMCGQRVALANRKLRDMIENEEDRKNVVRKFRLCDDMTQTSDDVSTLFAELAKNLAYAVDFANVNRNPRNDVTVRKLCEIMLNTAPALDSYAEVNNLNARGRLDPGRGCFDYRYANTINKLKQFNNNDTENNDRPWIYQICNEFGFFRSSNKTTGIFGDHFPATFLSKYCQDIFGSKFNMEYIEKKVSKINENYGGLEIDVNQTIFLYSPENPWRNLFITQNKTGRYEVFKFDGNPFSRNTLQSTKQYIGFNWGYINNVVSKILCLMQNGNTCFSNTTSIDYSEHKNIY